MKTHQLSIEDYDEDNSLLSCEIMLTTEMLRYYLIYPKISRTDFAVFYAPNHLTMELRLELEMILGIQIEFISLEETEILDLIYQLEEKEKHENRLAV